MSPQGPSLFLHSLPAQAGGSAILPLSEVHKLSLTISSLFNPCVSGSAIGPFTQPLILVCVWGLAISFTTDRSLHLNPCAPRSRLQAQQSMLGAPWCLCIILCYLSRLGTTSQEAPETVRPAR